MFPQHIYKNLYLIDLLSICDDKLHHASQLLGDEDLSSFSNEINKMITLLNDELVDHFHPSD